jgi:hypothetical protein
MDIYGRILGFLDRMVKSRRLKWTWHVARIGEKKNVYRILVAMPEGNRPLERPIPR